MQESALIRMRRRERTVRRRCITRKQKAPPEFVDPSRNGTPSVKPSRGSSIELDEPSRTSTHPPSTISPDSPIRKLFEEDRLG